MRACTLLITNKAHARPGCCAVLFGEFTPDIQRHRQIYKMTIYMLAGVLDDKFTGLLLSDLAADRIDYNYQLRSEERASE